MKKPDEIKKIALSSIELESTSINGIKKFINNDFVSTVQMIIKSQGRVVITGIGKSALIAQKIVATLNSTGTPSIFMHAADAIHGDLGIIQNDDIVVCISNSGSTPEIKVLIPLLRLGGNKLVAMCGKVDSFLSKNADFTLLTTVEREACPFNLTPTSSTTAQMVMGDALAIALLSCRGFTSKDFARFHPGGSLGKKLYLTVGELCASNEKPKVAPNTAIRDVIIEISSRRLGTTAVVDSKGKIVGIITDGDLRRMLQKYSSIDKLCAKDIMTPKPFTLDAQTLAYDALHMMYEKKITQVLITSKSKYAGVVHMHDILKEGIY
ncbi:MAG: KpsF/GutQ family sugar-phosphate isomerase [Bacteroidota bacterium]